MKIKIVIKCKEKIKHKENNYLYQRMRLWYKNLHTHKINFFNGSVFFFFYLTKMLGKVIYYVRARSEEGGKETWGTKTIKERGRVGKRWRVRPTHHPHGLEKARKFKTIEKMYIQTENENGLPTPPTVRSCT